jgi:hypothetical protein
MCSLFCLLKHLKKDKRTNRLKIKLWNTEFVI